MVYLYDLELSPEQLPVLVREKAFFTETEYFDFVSKIIAFFNLHFRLSQKAEENIFMLALNCRCKPIGLFHLSKGDACSAILNPREVLIRALLAGASGIILIHNHPSGCSDPSSDDQIIFERIHQSAKLIGIDVFDFIVIGNDNYFSWNENNYHF